MLIGLPICKNQFNDDAKLQIPDSSQFLVSLYQSDNMYNISVDSIYFKERDRKILVEDEVFIKNQKLEWYKEWVSTKIKNKWEWNYYSKISKSWKIWRKNGFNQIYIKEARN